jgi:hypothetical protein
MILVIGGYLLEDGVNVGTQAKMTQRKIAMKSIEYVFHLSVRSRINTIGLL